MSYKLGLLLVSRFVNFHLVITVLILHEVPPPNITPLSSFEAKKTQEYFKIRHVTPDMLWYRVSGVSRGKLIT